MYRVEAVAETRYISSTTNRGVAEVRSTGGRPSHGGRALLASLYRTAGVHDTDWLGTDEVYPGRVHRTGYSSDYVLVVPGQVNLVLGLLASDSVYLINRTPSHMTESSK